MGKNKYIEKECQRHGETTYVLESSGYYRCKKCRVANMSKSRKNLKRRLVDHYGGECTSCGYNKTIEALVFHHRIPKNKSFSISSTVRNFKEMKKEAEKCDLLCANCHAEAHADK